MSTDVYSLDDMSVVHHVKAGLYFLIIGGDTYPISADVAARLVDSGITISEGS